jgi:arsenite methyltransferase
MAITAPAGFDVARLRHAIRVTYERVALDPSGAFHFNRGRDYAVELLGYDGTELDSLPSEATERFAGVGNPLQIGPIAPGETVLDHACGAGMDLLLAARRVGPSGRAIGVDVTAGMREVAQRAATQAGLAARVAIRAGSYDDLPLPSDSVDVVISNGVVNLAPEKKRVLGEVWRVLRPGGRLYLADVVVARELELTTRQQPELWAACIAGALPESELGMLASAVGFSDTRTLAHRDLRVRSLNFFARKPHAVTARARARR